MSRTLADCPPVFRLVTLIALLTANHTHACERLSFNEPWIREPPPVSRVAAGYVSITNSGTQEIAISTIDSSCCEHVMIHETVIKNDKARMVHRKNLTVPANAEVTLAPLGTHMMLMGVQSELREGDELTLTFTCSDQKSTAVTFPVVKR